MSLDNREPLSSSDITRHLRAVRYPADRDALLRCAREAQAPPEVLDILGRFEDRIFGGVAEVSEALCAVTRAPWDFADPDQLVEKGVRDTYPASDVPTCCNPFHPGAPSSRHNGEG